VAETVKVSVLPAEPVTEAGLKTAVTPVGRVLKLNATAPSKLPNSLTVTLLVRGRSLHRTHRSGRD
jgi:hypothetical protein